jgi:hypothetical protein
MGEKGYYISVPALPDPNVVLIFIQLLQHYFNSHTLPAAVGRPQAS